MNTLPQRRCQTALAALALTFFWAAGFVLGQNAAPAPSPLPDWQRDLNALHLVETAAALADARADADPKAVETRRQQITRTYQQLAERYPQQAEIQRAGGDFYWRNEQFDAALPYWQRAQTLAPTDAETAESLGSAYLRLGQVKDAAAQYQRAVDARPDLAMYHFELANVLYLFRHELTSSPAPTPADSEAVLLRALEHFRRAAELAPTDRKLAQAYAETFYNVAKPDWNTALAAWEAVLTLSAQSTDFPNLHLARVSLRLSRPEEVRKYLARINSPEFAALKDKLLKQADQINPTKGVPK